MITPPAIRNDSCKPKIASTGIAAGEAAAAAMSEVAAVSVAVIGAGRMGALHARVLSERREGGPGFVEPSGGLQLIGFQQNCGPVVRIDVKDGLVRFD